MAICVECKRCLDFDEHDLSSDQFTCGNPDLAISDFVRGIRLCYILNPQGNCKGFKPQSQPESIYELKKDEELAKT